MGADECGGPAKPYEHHGEGFLVDRGEAAAAANLLNIPLSGPAANVVTRGYHLSAMSGNRMRVLADWTLNTVTPPEATSFGLISAESVPLDVDNPRACRDGAAACGLPSGQLPSAPGRRPIYP